jgi:hypothetical protein
VQKFEAIITDNAAPNNVLYRTIEVYYKDKEGKKWLVNNWRIRYIDYIINLVVQIFLFVNIIDLDELESYDLKNADGKFTDKKITRAKFKFLEPFGQKYNIVIHIRGLSVRTDYFRKLVKRIILINNRTKWNS